MVDVMTYRRRRGARGRLAAALAYGAMGWPVCTGAHPLRGPGFRAAPQLRGGQRGHAHADGVGRACSCDRVGCPDPGAHPVSPAWQIEATVDSDVIAAWWRAQPEANVVLVTGRVFDVLDVPAAAGRIALSALADAGDDIGPVATSDPDRYLFFVATRGAPADEDEWWSCHLDCAPDSIADSPGLRWHCRDSYVLAPPSQHISGHQAQWISPPERQPLPDSMCILPVLVDACEEAGG